MAPAFGPSPEKPLVLFVLEQLRDFDTYRRDLEKRPPCAVVPCRARRDMTHRGFLSSDVMDDSA